MIRFIVIPLILLVVLIGGLLYIGDEERVQLIALGRTIDVTLQFAIICVIGGIIALIALWSLLAWLWRLPGRVKSGVGLRRRNKALDAMEEALIAGSEGDASRARKKAERARALISSSALGRMVSAQAAEAAGDTEEAVTHYTAMLDDQKTLATGQRGLAQQLMSAGDCSGAIAHAQTAYADNKNAKWAFDILFQAQVADFRWHDAYETLSLGEKRKHIESETARRRGAVLLTAEADRLHTNGQRGEAADLAVKAASDAPEFAPANALAARLLKLSGNSKKAISLIQKSWSANPHPALALAYKDVIQNESPKARAKHMLALVKSNPAHRESILLNVEDLLLSSDGVAAWSALDPLLKEGEPSARLCALAAQAETMLNNPADARVWVERAATAPSEPDWSDLDPEGDAFEYSDQDWRRLVFSFGESGELIHPRFEASAPRRNPVAGLIKTPAEPNGTAKTRQPDDPGPLPAGGTDPQDLAERLDSLLGDKPAPKA